MRDLRVSGDKQTKNFPKTITLTRRTLAIVLSIAVVATVVSASLLSNYVIPSRVNVTTLPGISILLASFHAKKHRAGITVFYVNADGSRGAAVTSVDFGDVQQGQTKSLQSMTIVNSQGSSTQYLIDQVAGGNPSGISSLMLQNLPSGVSVTWNFASVFSPPINCGSPAPNYPCAGIAPGSGTQAITLTLTVSTSALGGVSDFSIVFNTYSTVSG